MNLLRRLWNIIILPWMVPYHIGEEVADYLWDRRPWGPKLRLGDESFWIHPDAGLDWKEVTLTQLSSDSKGNFMLPWRPADIGIETFITPRTTRRIQEIVDYPWRYSDVVA